MSVVPLLYSHDRKSIEARARTVDDHPGSLTTDRVLTTNNSTRSQFELRTNASFDEALSLVSTKLFEVIASGNGLLAMLCSSISRVVVADYVLTMDGILVQPDDQFIATPEGQATRRNRKDVLIVIGLRQFETLFSMTRSDERVTTAMQTLEIGLASAIQRNLLKSARASDEVDPSHTSNVEQLTPMDFVATVERSMPARSALVSILRPRGNLVSASER